MNKQRNWITTLGLCTALVGFSVMAADDTVMPPTAANDRPSMAADATGAPAPQRYDGVSVVNGGVDLDRAAAIKRMASQYKLRVEISGRGGAYYVADRLKLMRRGELITEITEAGPWLLFDVPPGPYTLVADFAGQQVKRDVTVADSGTTVHWVLPTSVN